MGQLLQNGAEHHELTNRLRGNTLVFSFQLFQNVTREDGAPSATRGSSDYEERYELPKCNTS